ncbi:hypothetical protein BGZ65_006310 [Modicella reniformis]|uniref:Uncharacterized protein n=1 Tax=Modicella reniformis TaxID=1440133 RepID=A0A9P6SQ53_9FUNG|nr:hypothetical protein BGZ65_006310 [Modicella reniformis]
MTNLAVAQWLQEIAAAKAKAQAKATPSPPNNNTSQDDVSPGREQGHSNTNTNKTTCGISNNGSDHSTSNTTNTTTRSKTTTTTCSTSSCPQHGIITSYNLKNRKKQLQLILPPEPIKPGPGECCGNDCDPCVNTIYWEDLAGYKDRVKKLEAEYEAACKALESGEETQEKESANLSAITREIIKEEEEEEEEEKEALEQEGLSIRSYKPFKILQKRYLTENALLVICDVPYPKPMKTLGGPSQYRQDIITKALFHILIRFKGEDQYLTKAFTPVDLSSRSSRSNNDNSSNNNNNNNNNSNNSVNVALGDKMAFLVKLYPSPHATSDMFRQLQEYNYLEDRIVEDAGEEEEEKGVLYLRGPIQTAKDQERNRDLALKKLDEELKDKSIGNRNKSIINDDSRPRERRKKERIVMIAAGSGITPMYQVLRVIHHYNNNHNHHHRQQRQQQQQQQQQQHQSDKREAFERIVSQELDLVYCNRTSSEIWLRQELQEICLTGQVHDDNDHDHDNKNNSAALTQPIEMHSASSSKESQESRRKVLTRKMRIHHVLSSSCTDHDQDLDGEKECRHHQGCSRHHQCERVNIGGRITLDLLRETLRGNIMSASDVGRVNTDSIQHSSFLEEEEEYLWILVCGPPLFNTDVSKMLDQLGYKNSDRCEIHILE